MKPVTTNPVASALLAKFKLEPEIRENLDAGVYKDQESGDRLSFLVKVEADQLRIGADVPSAKVTSAVPWQSIALLCLSKLNEASRETAMREAMTMRGLPEELDALIKVEARKAAQELIPTRNRKGAVTAKGLTFHIVTEEEASDHRVTEQLEKAAL